MLIYDVFPVCMGIVGITLFTFGLWGILQWDAYSKFLANVKDRFIKIVYNSKKG